MKLWRRTFWLRLAIRCTPLLAGGLIPFTLGGCDTTVKDEALTGIQTTLTDLPTQFINMFIRAFTNAFTAATATTTTTTTTTAKAAFDCLQSWIA